MAHTRKFVDSEGVHWQVYELSGEGAGGELRADRWLYFFSRGATRSLTAYPDDWAVMDWPGLEKLCNVARPPARREAKREPAVAQTVDV